MTCVSRGEINHGTIIVILIKRAWVISHIKIAKIKKKLKPSKIVITKFINFFFNFFFFSYDDR